MNTIRKRIAITWILTVALGLLLSLVDIGKVAYMSGTYLYASPAGSGSVCSLAAPCSLEGARDKVRTMNANMTEDIVVLLRGGTYSLSSPFELTESGTVHDSGTNGYNVIYRAYPDEVPILSGGESVPGNAWTLHDGGRNIYKADVGSLDTRQLYVNGIRAERARGESFPSGFVRTSTGYTLPSTGAYAGMAGWDNIGDIEMVIFYQWKSLRCPVASVSGSALTMQEPCWSLLAPATTAAYPTWVENAYELLDEEGEWYLDRTGAIDGNAGTLYYKPRSGESMATSEVVAGAAAETLIRGTGTLDTPLRNVRIEGLTFMYTTWMYPSGNGGFPANQAASYVPPGGGVGQPPAAADFRAAKSVRLERNVFRHLGGTAISLEYGSQHNEIIGNVVEDVSATGIKVGFITNEDRNPADSRKIVKNNTVRNNYIVRAGAEYHGATGIFVGYTDQTIIEHNELYDLPYTGISVGWGWSTDATTAQNNVIRYNRIHRHMNTLRDGGGIYLLGNQPNSTISHNYISDQYYDLALIYLDNGTQGFDVHHNVLENGGALYWTFVTAIAPTATLNTLRDNYTDIPQSSINAGNTVSGNTYGSSSSWPSAAQTIIADAGIESAYIDIKDVVEEQPVMPEPSYVNVALSRTATASSYWDASMHPSKAADGNLSTAWASKPPYTSPPWWQVDLGAAYPIAKLELVNRQDNVDHVYERRNYEVLASNDPTFSTYAVIAKQGNFSIGYKQTWSSRVDDPTPYRYVRVVKNTEIVTLVFAEFRVLVEP
ncbi:MAG: hypothetical protein K0Q94_1443 [Paenibacillus sp.]|jgi:hypothetical protein|nr:hypothetical protein [Paenibacillus sp.]